MGELVELQGINKRFDSLQAVDQVDLTLKRGEVFSLLGPSGCGKTTLLRILAGFEKADSGRVLLDGQDITELPPHRRAINTVFQNYALFPHMTLYENIAFGLQMKRLERHQIRREVEAMLALMDLEQHAYKKPNMISGGQKQRVAIARALVNKPQLLLLDEPLAALDLKLRQRMLIELDTIHDEVGITFLYITHDQGEAMSLSDRIAVMNEGRIEQIGSPAEIYEAPQNSFVAAFIGDTNFLIGKVKALQDRDLCVVTVDSIGEVLVWNDKKLRVGDDVSLSVRPEKFRLFRNRPEPNPMRNVIQARVEDLIYMGSLTKYRLVCGEYTLIVEQQHGRYLLDEQPITWGESVWLGWHAEDGYMLQSYNESDEALMALGEEVSENAQS
ncbi:MAG: ABC transporter ATP-binding protein [Puniceicoccaceae bacterium]